MKAIHVISDSDAPVMLGAGLYLVKAYLTAWKIVMEQKGAMVGFVSPDREAIVTVTVASAQDVDPAAFAAEMAQGLGGSDIMEEDGVYSFAFGDNGVTVVHVAGTDLRVISIIGGHPALEGLIDSIEWR